MFRYLMILSIISLAGQVDAAIEPWSKWVVPELRKVESERKNAKAELEKLGIPFVGQTAPEIGYQRDHVKTPPLNADSVQIDLGSSQVIDNVVLVPAVLDWQSAEHPAYAFPLRFDVAISDDPHFDRFTLIKSFTDVDFPNPGIAPVNIVAGGKTARYVRLSVSKMLEVNHLFTFALSEIMVLSGNLNIAIDCPVRASASVESPPAFSKTNLVDGRTHLGPPVSRDFLEWDGLHAGEVSNAIPPWIELDLGKVVPIQQLRIYPTHAHRGADIPGFRFPKSFKVEVSKTASFKDPVVLMDVEDWSNPGSNPLTIPCREAEARYIKMTARFKNSPGGPRFSLSEVEVYSRGENVARGATVTRTPDYFPGSKNWPLSILVDGYASYGRLMELPEWLRYWDRRKLLQLRLKRLDEQEPLLMEEAHHRILLGSSSALVICVIVVFAFGMLTRLRTKQELHEVRARLARDIHDHIGSNLAGIAVLSEVARTNKSLNGLQLEDWKEVSHIARETMDVMREVIWVIGGNEGTALNLMTQMDLAASRMLAGKNYSWKSTIADLPPNVGLETRRDIFLLFKEALTNIVRHSNAKNVELSAKISRGHFYLEVADNGCGFDRRSIRAGIGLNSQRMRAHALGGKLKIISRPGNGASVYLDVPLGKIRKLLRFVNRLRSY